MKIKKIHIKNFKGFSDSTFYLNERVTVFIGDNGKGKTSVIEALAIAAGAYLLGIDEGPKIHIERGQIYYKDFGDRFAPQLPVEIWAEGSIDGIQNLLWGRTLASVKGRNTTKEAYPISEIAKKHEQEVNIKGNRVQLPILAYYGTGRLWVEKNKRIGTKGKGSILFDGYYACLEPKSSSNSYLEWIKTYEYNIKTQDKDETLLDLVKQAISNCIDNWEDIYFDLEEDDLVGTRYLEKGPKQRVAFKNLSDGQRTIAGIVGELAYRCITLNGHLKEKAITESGGVVLIDEIDQHLHPNWQRKIINDLKSTFPQIQFVATTHSPFIVQSLDANELVNLDNYSSDFSPNELALNKVATEIMGVTNIRADDFEERYKQAQETLEGLKEKGEELTLDTYQQISKELGTILKEESNDPVYRAYLDQKEEKK